jgi:YihY family inner membrane protein
MSCVKDKAIRVYGWGRNVVFGFVGNHCSMHAAGLTYFAMLALVPSLCLLLFAAKMCGVDDYARSAINTHIDEMIANIEKGQDDDVVHTLADVNVLSEEELEKKRIAALEFGAQAREISNGIFDRIDKFDVGTLGWIGFLFLLWTVISSLGMVEVSFNQIWSVAKPRPVWKRAYMYMFVSIILPVLVTLAMSMPILNVVKDVIIATLGATWLTKWVGDGLVWLIDSWLIRFAFTFMIASLNFALLFYLMPNCRVRFRAALWGGAITAFLYGGWMKVCAIAQVGIAKSSALYGSFAIFPILLAWMYMSWEIILLGANIVWAFQKEMEK